MPKVIECLPLGERMSCEIIEKSFDAIRNSPCKRLRRWKIEDVVFAVAWAKPYLADEQVFRKLRNRIGWCLDQLKTAGLIESVDRYWQLTGYGQPQTNGINGADVRKTVASIERAIL